MACIFGVVLLAISAGSILLNAVYRQQGRRAEGVVTYYGSTGGGTRSAASIRYRFTADDGQEYSGTQTGYSIERGSTIAIEYLQGHPNWNRVAGAGGRGEKFLLPIALAGLFFFWIGLQSIRRLSAQPQ
jgi:hypothetical protein